MSQAFRPLEFEKLLGFVSGFCLSRGGSEAVLSIGPLSGRRDIAERLGLVQDLRRLSSEGDPLRLSPFDEIPAQLEEARPEGAVLDPSALISILSALGVMSEVSSQLAGRGDLPFLSPFSADLTGFPDLLALIGGSIDGEGRVKDGASFELYEIRGRIRGLEKRISRRLEEIAREKETSVFLQDGFVTKRSGRWVIPVRMDSKGQVPGVVHDVSRSGDTAFVEPLEIIGLSNEHENLLAEEKAEVIRILRGISRAIRAEADPIKAQYEKLVRLDMLNGIARFSDSLGMEPPAVGESGVLRLVGARHPLLMMLGKKDGVVPLDMALGGDGCRVMLITGPNAGGKTIALKTAGLLLLMALSGMPVSADSSSDFPLVEEVLVDIGDEQSIERSLSTFSAHASNMAAILGRASPGTLVLVDELGTGTDPAEGAALGCAVLKALKDRGALVLATTHLVDIAVFVQGRQGMANASMKYDPTTLAPLYRLVMGEPGESHALDVAARYGIPEETIELAKDLMGRLQAEFHALLAELKTKRAEYEDAMSALGARAEALERERALLEERLRRAEAERERIIEKAYLEAGEVVSRAKREIHGVLEEARREKRKSALKKAEALQKEIDEGLRSKIKAEDLDPARITLGVLVHVGSIGMDAEVIAVDKRRRRARLRAGGKEIEARLSDIGPARGGAQASFRPGKDDEAGAAASRIILVGLRVDEALSRLEPFLNRALLAGIDDVLVVHGVGTGALMRAVREHLEGHPLVEGYRGGGPEEGGPGVTVVRLR